MSTKGFTNNQFATPGTLSCANATLTNTAATVACIRGATSSADFMTFAIAGSNIMTLRFESTEIKMVSPAGVTPLVCTSNASANLLTLTEAGIHRFPLSTGVVARNTAQVDNITGNGATYTCAFATEIIDQAGGWSTNTFTAALQGIFLFTVTVHWLAASTATVYTLDLVASNRTIRFTRDSPASQASSGTLIDTYSMAVDMDAADTATIQAALTGVGADSVDWGSDATNLTARIGVVKIA